MALGPLRGDPANSQYITSVHHDPYYPHQPFHSSRERQQPAPFDHSKMSRNLHNFWLACKHSVTERRKCTQRPHCPLQLTETHLLESPYMGVDPDTGLSKSSFESSKTTFHSTGNTNLQVSGVKETPILETFELFAELPPELQLEIWRHTFTPRHVEVEGRYSRPQSGYHGLGDIIHRGYVRPKTSNPVALRVNRQSRDEALRFYKPLFPNLTDKGPIYFCSQLDSFTPLYFSLYHLTDSESGLHGWSSIDPESFGLIESLTAPGAMREFSDDPFFIRWQQFRPEIENLEAEPDETCKPSIYLFPNLKEVVLQTEEERSCYNHFLTTEGRKDYKKYMLNYFHALQAVYPECKIPKISVHLPPGRFEANNSEKDKIWSCCSQKHTWRATDSRVEEIF